MTHDLPRWAPVVALCVLLAACAQDRTMSLEAAPTDLFDKSFPIDVRGSHTVAHRHGKVVAGTAEGIGIGMGTGALGSVGGGAATGSPLGLALGIVLMPVFAVGGGVYGAVAAHPTLETDAAIGAIERLYDDDRFLDAMDGFVKERLSTLAFPEQPKCDGAPSSDFVPRNCGPEMPGNKLTLTVTYGFSTKGTYSPDLKFGVEVSAVAANADRKRAAEEYRWVYRSPELDFFSETADEAAGLRRKLADVQQRLADTIVDDLFLTRRPIKVTGKYFPDRKGTNFVPVGIPTGTVSRVPTTSQLIAVPVETLEE